MNAKFDDFIQERVTNEDFCTRVSTFETINSLKESIDCLILQQTQKKEYSFNFQNSRSKADTDGY